MNRDNERPGDYTLLFWSEKTLDKRKRLQYICFKWDYWLLKPIVIHSLDIPEVGLNIQLPFQINPNIGHAAQASVPNDNTT